MIPYSYKRQIRAVFLTQLCVGLGVCLVAYLFWTTLCDDTLASCVATGDVLGPLSFILLATIRPFVFTPMFFIAALGGRTYDGLFGTLTIALGATLSAAAVFGIAKLLGKRLAKPWLRSNLPATFSFLRSQDYKMVFAARLLPMLPFDIVSFIGGALDFRTKSMVLATFIGVLPEAWLFANLLGPNSTTSNLIAELGGPIIIFYCFSIIVIIFTLELAARRHGNGLWHQSLAMYNELLYEIRSNNEIVRHETFSSEKTPVLLLYGFFSSRRAVSVLERMLTNQGRQVLSFNLGGLFGTFFTKGILETASFVEEKLARQMARHGFTQVDIVAHSKGGMVALWWLLALGGHRHCRRVITMGTPFVGTRLTYLALITPLGFWWRDVWQMRPNSSFIKRLHRLEVPSNLNIYCLHSAKDRVAPSTAGLFRPVLPVNKRDHQGKIHSIAMNNISHFEFLYRREVVAKLGELLGPEPALVVSLQDVLPASEQPDPAVQDRTTETAKSIKDTQQVS